MTATSRPFSVLYRLPAGEVQAFALRMLQQRPDFPFQYDCRFKGTTLPARREENSRTCEVSLNVIQAKLMFFKWIKMWIKLGECIWSSRDDITGNFITLWCVLKQTFHAPRGNIWSTIPGLSSVFVSNDADLEGQVLIHYRYTLLTVRHLEINIHIMLIFIILGARLRQDEDTDSRQALTLIERQDARTWPPEPLSVPFRGNKLRRVRQALNLKVTEPFEISVEARALPCYQNRTSTPGFACIFWALGFPKNLPWTPTDLWTPRILKNSLSHSGWIEI